MMDVGQQQVVGRVGILAQLQGLGRRARGDDFIALRDQHFTGKGPNRGVIFHQQVAGPRRCSWGMGALGRRWGCGGP